MSKSNPNLLRALGLLAAITLFAVVINGKQLAGWATGADVDATGCSEDVYLDDGARGLARTQHQSENDCKTPSFPDEDETEAECGDMSVPDPGGTCYLTAGPDCTSMCKKFKGLSCRCGGQMSETGSLSVGFGVKWLGLSSQVSISTTKICNSATGADPECHKVQVYGCAYKLTSTFTCPKLWGSNEIRTVSTYEADGVMNHKKPDPSCKNCCSSESSVSSASSLARTSAGAEQSQGAPDTSNSPSLMVMEVELTGTDEVDDLSDDELCAYVQYIEDELDVNPDLNAGLRVFHLLDDGALGGEFIWDAKDDLPIDCD